MTLPITQEQLQEFETMLSEKESKPISKERQEHAMLVANLINTAYLQGYKKGVSEVLQNE